MAGALDTDTYWYNNVGRERVVGKLQTGVIDE
jgi:hypothetical protein